MRGYERLSSKAQTLFSKVHSLHLQAMGRDERKKYELPNIKQIVQNNKEQCVEVHYQNGEFFKYYPNLTWG